MQKEGVQRCVVRSEVSLETMSNTDCTVSVDEGLINNQQVSRGQ